MAAWRYVELDAGDVDVDVDEQIQRVCAAERAAVCDLADPPAFRVALIRTAEDRHRLVLTNHHIVLDGWSLPILLREIFASYYGQRLPAAASYRRFVSWLADRDLDAAHAAWREVLAGFDTPTLVGPPDRLGLGRRGVESFRVPAETTRALSELARSHHTTVNTVLQAAFAQLLMGLTGQHDVVFGAVVSGRPAEVAGAESMVGLLINTVPVRAQHHAGNHHHRPARPAAKRPQPHTRAPAPGAQRDPPHHRPRPAVRHRFRVRKLPDRHRRVVGRRRVGHHRDHHRDSYHYPLTVQAMPGGRTGPSRPIRTDVFDVASIEALIERLKRVLVAMTADPTRRLSAMDVLDAGEHARLDGWGNRAVLTQPATTAVSIPVLFAAQVARTPEAVAVTFEGRSMTYRELEEAANRLAHLLAGQGAGPGQCVALLFTRSADAIVAMLAVLKTGAAYLPIDPGLPAARIGFMIEDAAPIAAITTAGLADRLEGCDLPVIDVEDSAVDSQPSTALPAPGPDDIAYLIYISGHRGAQGGGGHSRQRHPVPASLEPAWLVPGRCGRSAIPWPSTSRCGRSSVRCCVVGGWWRCPSRWRVTGDFHAWRSLNRSACSARPRRRWRRYPARVSDRRR